MKNKIQTNHDCGLKGEMRRRVLYIYIYIYIREYTTCLGRRSVNVSATSVHITWVCIPPPQSPLVILFSTSADQQQTLVFRIIDILRWPGVRDLRFRQQSVPVATAPVAKTRHCRI